MAHLDISARRLLNQRVAGPLFGQASEVVEWLGAVQAQDYLGALWALGARTTGLTEQQIEQEIAEKRIVRTWPMRGTIHFVAPADARWMLELLTPRVVQRSQSRLKQLEIDSATITASAKVIANALQGGQQIARSELYNVLERANIAAGDQRGLHILGQLAQAGLICFGARAGKQPTFVLLDEWAPQAKSLPREEALCRLALRYFTGHGPATLADFIWWSGLLTQDARAALAAAAPQLERELIGGEEYYYHQSPAAQARPAEAYLLPPFDEFLVAYRNRSASLDPKYNSLIVPGGNGIFNPIIVIDAQVVGIWKRAFKKDAVTITLSPFAPLSDQQLQAIAAAAERYGSFVGKAAVLA